MPADKITKSEYDTFIEENNIDNIDNISRWSRSKYDDFVEELNDIRRSGIEAYSRIDKAKVEDLEKLFKRYRNGVTAYNLMPAVKKFRYGESKYARFYDEFEHSENIRMSERSGTGAKIFTSVTEMIGRLMLLISSKEAGNVGVEIDNEIIDILDHLRSENLLASDEYEILHRDLI